MAVQTIDIPMTISGNVGHRHQHSLRGQPRPYTSIWLLVVAWLMDINMASTWPFVLTRAIDIHIAPSHRRIKDANMVLGSNRDHGYQHGLRWQYRPCTSYMASSGIIAHRYQIWL